MAYYDHDGMRRLKATPFKVGQEKQAKALLRKVNERIAVGELDQVGPETVASYGNKYIKKRKRRIKTGKDEETRLKKHVFTRIGAMRLDEVKPRHMEELIWGMRENGELAPRTIIHTWGAICRMFKSAVKDELIPGTPCLLDKGVLPKNVDKYPSWRATAIYARSELEQLISDQRVPWARRVLYALKFLAGTRQEETALLKWEHHDASRQPLGCLTIAKTKTGITRYVPIHPTLAAILAEWKLSGWRETYGRAPRSEDFIVPTSRLTARINNVSRDLHLDLDTLGFRHRRGHDMKRTHISLLNTDGARRDLRKLWTHGASSNILDVYTTIEWPVLCAEMSKLKVQLRSDAQVIKLVKSGSSNNAGGNFCYPSATGGDREQKNSTNSVIPA